MPQHSFAIAGQELAGAPIDRSNEVWLVGGGKVEVGVVAAVLGEGAVGQLHQRRPLPHPLLQGFVLAQLIEVVPLAADADPEADSSGIAQRPEHRDFVVAQQDLRVGTVPRVAQSSNAEHPVVDEVAEEDGAPFGRRVRLECGEEALDVPVHVADDQDRQIVRSHSSPGPSTRRTARVQEPMV